MLNDDHPPVPGSDAEKRSSTGEVRRILVVDDDVDLVRLLEGLLRDHGYSPIVATGRNEALEILDSSPIDLLVLDLYLPDTTGLALLRGARRMRPGVKAIILTAGGDLETYLDALEEGVFAYLTTPLVPDELLAEVRALFAGAR